MVFVVTSVIIDKAAVSTLIGDAAERCAVVTGAKVTQGTALIILLYMMQTAGARVTNMGFCHPRVGATVSAHAVLSQCCVGATVGAHVVLSQCCVGAAVAWDEALKIFAFCTKLRTDAGLALVLFGTSLVTGARLEAFA